MGWEMKYACVLCLCAVMGLASAARSESAEPVHIIIVHTNDVHGGIDPTGATFMDEEFPPALGGGPSLTRLVKFMRQKAAEEGKGFLLIDTGDIWQGTPVGNYDNGRVVIEFMNRLGYDLWTPGNHEFDAGIDNFFRTINLAEFPVVSANVVETETGGIPSPMVPYVIKEVAGIRIGVIGLITEETPYYALPEDVKVVEFVDVKAITEKYIAEIEDKVDLIFVTGHLGIPYDVDSEYAEMIETGAEQKIRYGMNAMELAHYVKGIDLMLCGHIHVGYERGWEDPLTHTICLPVSYTHLTLPTN